MSKEENIKEINKLLAKKNLKIEEKCHKLWFTVYRLTVDGDCREWESWLRIME